MPKPKSDPALKMPDAATLERFVSIVGTQHALMDEKDQQPYLTEWRDKYVGQAAAVLRPGSVDEVSQVLKLANEARIGVVPQAGNTGLVGGQIPFEHGREIVLSVGRLTNVREMDAANRQIAVDAGVALQAVQDAAADAGLLFPLSLASEGSCQIGGNIATNAGGVGVLKYGNMRELVLGLEVVLADGRIFEHMSPLKKDNTGYDLKNIFIGAEGTLGVITGAVLKLFAQPRDRATALVALSDLDQTQSFFESISIEASDDLTAFEFFPRRAMEFVTRAIPGTRDPFDRPHPWYVLLELSSPSRNGTPLSQRLETSLGSALEADVISDAILAASQAQAEDLWRLRESISEAQKPEGGSIKHDISVPDGSIAKFIRAAEPIVEAVCPGARPVPFGHFGDGNIHFNISQPEGMARAVFLEHWEKMSLKIHDLVADMGGSISAEHGIGRMKREALLRYKTPVEIEMMRALKSAFDPNGILNPGKLL